MIRFLHPNAVWLFLLFIPLAALLKRKQIPQRVTVASLALWESQNEKSRKGIGNITSFFARIPLSAWCLLGAIALLILALMTPVYIPNFSEKIEKAPLRLQRFGPSIEPLERALNALPSGPAEYLNAPPHSVPPGTLLILTGPVNEPFPTGNILLAAERENTKGENRKTAEFRIISASPDSEVCALEFDIPVTKTVQFPVQVSDAVRHFADQGVPLRRTSGAVSMRMTVCCTLAAFFLCLIGFILQDKRR